MQRPLHFVDAVTKRRHHAHHACRIRCMSIGRKMSLPEVVLTVAAQMMANIAKERIVMKSERRDCSVRGEEAQLLAWRGGLRSDLGGVRECCW